MDLNLLSKTVGALTKRSNEKVELQQLNTRFSSYIEKVKNLELKNQAEPGQSHESSSIIRRYEEEIRKLKKKVESLNKEKSLLEEEQEILVNGLQSSLEQERHLKEAAVTHLDKTRKQLKDSNVKWRSLEIQIQTLKEDIKFMQDIHEKEILMLKSWKGTGNIVQTDSSKPDLTLALQGIRSQYEDMVQKNLSEAESRYKIQVLDMSKALNTNSEALNKAQKENKDLRQKILTVTQEIESLKSEMQVKDETISKLTQENTNMKTESEHYIHDFQKLLDVKLALDMEIAYYKDLLDKEEIRIKSIGHTDKAQKNHSPPNPPGPGQNQGTSDSGRPDASPQ